MAFQNARKRGGPDHRQARCAHALYSAVDWLLFISCVPSKAAALAVRRRGTYQELPSLAGQSGAGRKEVGETLGVQLNQEPRARLSQNGFAAKVEQLKIQLSILERCGMMI